MHLDNCLVQSTHFWSGESYRGRHRVQRSALGCRHQPGPKIRSGSNLPSPIVSSPPSPILCHNNMHCIMWVKLNHEWHGHSCWYSDHKCCDVMALDLKLSRGWALLLDEKYFGIANCLTLNFTFNDLWLFPILLRASLLPFFVINAKKSYYIGEFSLKALFLSKSEACVAWESNLNQSSQILFCQW